MSIEKCKDFIKDGFGTWDDSSKPTTFANMYDFMKNQNNVTFALANGLWQPSTAYSVGAVVHSPSLPAGCKATCTTAGTTGSAEPKWTAYGTTVTDGTAKWKVETDVQGTITCEMQTAITSAIEALHDTIKTEMQTAMLALFPVGAILEATNDANPSTYIGGTWEAMDPGRVLVSAGTASTGTVYNAGDKGGEEKHQLTESESAPHTHTRGTMNITGSVVGAYGYSKSGSSGAFTYSSTGGSQDGGDNHDGEVIVTSTVYFDASRSWTGATSSSGGGQAHNNMQPYETVYRWKRTA